MNNNRKYFIQYMIKNGVSTVEDAITFCKHVSKDDMFNIDKFKSLVNQTNKEITKHSFQMVFDICEVTGNEVIVWINATMDVSNLQVVFNELELEYFHAILQEILMSETYKIPFITCLNITSSLTGNLSRSNAQKVLDKLTKVGYYINKDGYIHLGSRLIIEFNTYLNKCCPNLKCNLCNELVFTGRQCSCCKKLMHSICLSKYLERQNYCPCCQSEWVEVAGSNLEGYNRSHEEDDLEPMEVTEVFEDDSNVETNNSDFRKSQLSSATSNNIVSDQRFARLRTRRTTEEDLLEAGPSRLS